MGRWMVSGVVLLTGVLGGCGSGGKPGGQQETGTPTSQVSSSGFVLRSTAFASMQTIPAEHRHPGADGRNESPPLEWTDPPAGTQAFALICFDPDAPSGEFVHWVVYDLPGDVRRLERGLGRAEKLPNGACQGKNDFEHIGYDGPAPPPGMPHRYIFRLYALDRPVRLPPGATRQELEKAIQGHILGQAELIGVYAQKP